MRYSDTSLMNWRHEKIVAIEAATQLTGSRFTPQPRSLMVDFGSHARLDLALRYAEGSAPVASQLSSSALAGSPPEASFPRCSPHAYDQNGQSAQLSREAEAH